MATKSQLRKEAAKHNATIHFSEYPENRETVIEAEAPDGMQWKNGECLFLVARSWSYVEGDRANAYQELITRMEDGLEPIDETVNPQ